MQTAIRLAKRMIVDGEMPTPEEAHQQLEERSERERARRAMGAAGGSRPSWGRE